MRGDAPAQHHVKRSERRQLRTSLKVKRIGNSRKWGFKPGVRQKRYMSDPRGINDVLFAAGTHK